MLHSIAGYNPDNADVISRRRAMQSALHPRSETAGYPLLRRRRRRHRRSTPSAGKLLAAVTLMIMSAVMAILFALLALFLWRQGLTSSVVYLSLADLCLAPLMALRPPKEDSRNDIELTLRA